ncbi:MAG TPA: hypothetical protein VF616_12890 [Duganella sp.]|uniref:hypothetical protein n=1 Tax=Duganella sp. TaxID=1904440 RepID=UPI002ED080FC
MATVFKPGDETLQQLVAARRDEVVRLQQSEAQQLQDIEKRGGARAKELHDGLPAELVAFMDKQSKAQDDASTEAKREVEEIKNQLIDMPVAAEGETAIHPGLAGNQLIAASALGWFSPYYGVLHWSDGTVVWEGYNPGNIDLWDWAEGAGTGNGGTGAASRTLIMDWWFTYIPTTSGYYNHSISVPYHGFYIVRAFDDWLTSKEAQARIDLSAVGYQYGYKATSSINLLNVRGTYINTSGRFDGSRTMVYTDMLAADRAYLRVSSSFNVYARGSGSYAQLNFNDGAANYIGVPWVYVY